MSPDIEHGVVVRSFHVGETLCGSELLLDSGVLEELGDVVRERPDAVFIYRRVGALGRSEVEVVLLREDWGMEGG